MLAVGVLAGSLPYFFSYLEKIGIPATPSDCTLVLCSLLATVLFCMKNSSPDQEAQMSFNGKGKELNIRTKTLGL